MEIPISNSFAPTEIVRVPRRFAVIYCHFLPTFWVHKDRRFFGPSNPHPWHNRVAQPGEPSPTCRDSPKSRDTREVVTTNGLKMPCRDFLEKTKRFCASVRIARVKRLTGTAGPDRSCGSPPSLTAFERPIPCSPRNPLRAARSLLRLLLLLQGRGG